MALQAFCDWYRGHFAEMMHNVTLFTISAEGHFHIGEKRAKELVKECKRHGMIQITRNGNIKFNTNT